MYPFIWLPHLLMKLKNRCIDTPAIGSPKRTVLPPFEKYSIVLLHVSTWNMEIYGTGTNTSAYIFSAEQEGKIN